MVRVPPPNAGDDRPEPFDQPELADPSADRLRGRDEHPSRVELGTIQRESLGRSFAERGHSLRRGPGRSDHDHQIVALQHEVGVRNLGFAQIVTRDATDG